MRDENGSKEKKKARLTIAGGILALVPRSRRDRVRKYRIRKKGRKLAIRMSGRIRRDQRTRKSIPV